MARPVIGAQFIVPYEFNVIVNICSSGHLVITDIHNTVMLTIRSCDTTFHSQLLLRDERGRPIATLREKKRTCHDRWNAFRGESIADTDNMFTAATNHIIQFGTHVNVFLANNTSDDCDFQIRGSWPNRSCAIYKGDSSTIIAQMQLWQSPERFTVTINPNVDYAFVVALIAILNAMKGPGKTEVVAGRIASESVGVAGVAAQFFGAAMSS